MASVKNMLFDLVIIYNKVLTNRQFIDNIAMRLIESAILVGGF